MPTITEETALRAFEAAKAFPDDAEVQTRANGIRDAYRKQQEQLGKPVFENMARQEAERQRATRRVFQDRETHGLDGETLEKLNAQLRDRPEEKFEVFNERFFSESYGMPMEQVRTMRRELIGEYSEKTWGERVDSDEAFYQRMGQEFDFEDEISQKAQELALSGSQSWEVDAALDFDYVEDPRYKGREDARRKQFRAAYDGVKSQLSGLEPTARVFVDQLKNQMGVGEGAGQAALPDQWFLETVMNIPKDKRDLFLATVAARAGEGEAKTLFQAMAERMGRTATDIVRASNATARLTKLDQLARHVATNGAVTGLPDEFGFSPDEYLTGYLGSKEAADRADKSRAPKIGSEEFKALSPEQQAELERIEEEREFVLLYKKVNDIATGAIDPAKGSNFYTSGLIGVSAMAPNLVLMGAGPAGWAVNARGYISQRTMDHAAANPGVDTRDSLAVGTASGIAESMLDLIPTKIIAGKTPLVSKWLNKATLTGGGLTGRAAVRFGAGTAFEGATEFTQDVVVPSAIEDLANALKSDIPEANWDARLAGFTSDESLSELIPSIIMLSLIGSGVGGVRDYKGGWELVGNRNLLIGAGINEADADAIVSAAQKEDAAGAQSLLRDSFAKLDQTKEISAVLPEARRAAIRNIQAETKKRLEAIEKGEASGIIPVVGRTSEGWSLRFQDGTTRTYANHAEADAARWSYAAEKQLSELDSFRGAITQVEQQLEAGREVVFDFDDRRDDLGQAVQRGEVSRGAAMRRANIAEDVGGQELQSDPNAEREQEIDPEQEYQDSFTAAELQTLAEDDRLSLFQILGSNKTEFAEGVQRTTVKLFRGATPLTVIEEKLEGDADIMLKDAAKREWLLYSLIRFQRTSGQRIFREGITRNEDITDSDLKEAWSHLGQSYLVGRSRKSERADLGFLGAGGRKAAADILKSGLGGSMEGYHRFFRSVWKRAAKLNKLRREGKLDAELERELARSVGFGEQAEYEASVETEAAALLREMEESEMVREPLEASTFEPTDDAPFSVIRRNAMDAVEENGLYDLSGNPMAVNTDGTVTLYHRTTPEKAAALKASGKFKSLENTDETFFSSLSDGQAAGYGEALITVRVNPAFVRLDDAFDDEIHVTVSNKNLSLANLAKDEQDSEPSFSVITNAESRIAESFNPFLRNPEQRRKIVLEAQKRSAEKGRVFQEIIRFNRSGADIERERKTREADLMGEKLDTLSPSEIGALEASGTLDDVGMRPILSDLLREKYYKTKSGKSVKYWRGSLMSKSAAERAGMDTKGGEWDSIPEGLPPYVWGGSITPDRAANQFGFESVDEFWTALSSEVASYQNLKADTKAAMTRIRELEKEAAAESRVWAEEQKKLRRTVGTDRATLIAAMRTLDAMISALPSEIRGKVGGFVRLAQFKTPGAMLDELERRANRLDTELERWLKKEADKGVKKLFERAKPAKDESGKKRVGKAGADIHDLFETARTAWKNWDAEKAEAHAVGIEAEVAKGELSPEWEAHKLLEAELVRSFGGWNQADSVRKNHALDTATEIWDRGYLEYREKKAKEKERRDGIRADLRADTGKAGKKSERALTEMAGVKLPGRARDFFLSLLNFEQLTQWAFGKESKWAQWFADEQRKAENAKLDAVQAVTEGIEDLFTELAGGNRFKGEQLQYRMMQRSLTATAADGDVVPLSELEALSALLMWQQEDGKRHLRGKRDENGNIISTWAYDEGFIDEISGKLSPEAWRVLGYLQGEMRKEHPQLNPIYREIYGINLPQNVNYWPMGVTPIQAAAGQTADPLTNSTVSTGSFTPGSLRTRSVSAIAEPKFEDAVATFIAHKKQIEHWKAHARFVLDANAVLGNREVGNSIEAAHGQEAVKIIRKWLDAIAQGGVRNAAADTRMMKLLEEITGRFAGMALVGRIGTIAIQSTQLAAASALMPTGAYVVRLGKLLSGNLGWGIALDSPYIRRRVDQQPVMVQAAMQGLRAGKPTQIKHQVRKLGSLLNGADALFTAGTYAIVYDYHFTQATRGGMDATEAAAYATETAERVTESVAQPTRLGTRSFFEVSTSNPLGRLAWAFASDARKNLGLLGFNWGKGNATDKYRATLFVIVLSGLMSSVIRSAWRDMRDGDDDEIFDEKYWSAKRILLPASTEWLFGFPVIGEEIQNAIYSLSGEYTPSSGSLSAIAQAPVAAKNILTGDSTDLLRDVEKVLTGIGLFSDNTAAATSVMHLVRDIFGLGENFTGE
jgi:hypothetical protein